MNARHCGARLGKHHVCACACAYVHACIHECAMNPLSFAFVPYPHRTQGIFVGKRPENSRLNLAQRCRKLSSANVPKKCMQCETRAQQFKHLRTRRIGAGMISRPRCKVPHFHMTYKIYIQSTIDAEDILHLRTSWCCSASILPLLHLHPTATARSVVYSSSSFIKLHSHRAPLLPPPHSSSSPPLWTPLLLSVVLSDIPASRYLTVS